MPKELNQQERQILKKFLNEVIVEEKDIRKVPTSFKEAKFCFNCVANDFMIPGLEFKDDLCPMCQTRELTDKLKSVGQFCMKFRIIKNPVLMLRILYRW